MTDHDASFLFYPHTRARTHRVPIGNDASASVMRHAGGRDQAPHCLIPFDRREGCQIEEAAKIAGKSVRTMRNWAEQHHLARRVGGGTWVFSRVALQMFLDGNVVALRAYLAGDRFSPVIVSYYESTGLTDLIRSWHRDAAAMSAELT